MSKREVKQNNKHPIKDDNGEIRERRVIRYEQFDVNAAESYFSQEIRETDWINLGKSKFGEDFADWKFKCPKCGTVSSGRDFLNKGMAAEKSRVVCIGCAWKADNFFGTFGKGLVLNRADESKIEVFPFAD